MSTGFISAAADGGSSPLPGTFKKAHDFVGLFLFYTVYILYSEKFNKHYTGYTSDLEQRLRSHNELGNEWTARYRPWKLIHAKQFETKKEAMAHEKWLKTGVGRDFIKSLSLSST